MPLMNRTILLVVLALLSGSYNSRVEATLIAVEDFESYTAGDPLAGLSGGMGWIDPWRTAGTGDYSISAGGLSYAGGDIAVNGGSQSLRFTFPDGTIQVVANRGLPAQSATLYLSLLYRPEVDTLGGNNDFMQVGLLDGDGNPTLSAMDRNRTFQTRAGTANGSDTGISTDVGNTYFLVLKMENTAGGAAYDRASLFVNPTSLTEAGNASVQIGVADVLDLSSTAVLNFRSAFQEAGDSYSFDHIRLGTTFSDVVTPAIPEPSSIGLLCLGLMVLTRKLKR